MHLRSKRITYIITVYAISCLISHLLLCLRDLLLRLSETVDDGLGDYVDVDNVVGGANVDQLIVCHLLKKLRLTPLEWFLGASCLIRGHFNLG